MALDDIEFTINESKVCNLFASNISQLVGDGEKIPVTRFDVISEVV